MLGGVCVCREAEGGAEGGVEPNSEFRKLKAGLVMGENSCTWCL